jgi:hypothetical protein
MYPRLGLGTVVRERWVLAVDGTRDLMADPKTGWIGSLSVKFSQEGLMKSDIDFALSYFPEKGFTGRWLDADGVTPQPLEERIGVYDTLAAQEAEDWPDELREYVEQWMLKRPNYGTDFVELQKLPAEKPWKNYDETHHFKIASLAADLGVVEEALAYEQENKAREGVLKALNEKLGAPVDVADEVVTA